MHKPRYGFDPEDPDSRLEFIADMYNALKSVDPGNELLKYAAATSTEVFFNRTYSKEFYCRFKEPVLTRDATVDTQLNYGVDLSYARVLILEKRLAIDYSDNY